MAKQKTPAQKETASPPPEEKLPESGPAIPDDPVGIGSPPGPKAMRLSKSRRSKKRNPQQEHQEVAELQQPSSPPPDNVDPATEPGDAKAASPKTSGNSPDPPKREVVDLTIKEESRSATPIPPTGTPRSNEGPAGLKAGWVRFRAFWFLIHSDKKLGLVPTFERPIAFHGHQEAVFDHRRGD